MHYVIDSHHIEPAMWNSTLEWSSSEGTEHRSDTITPDAQKYRVRAPSYHCHISVEIIRACWNRTALMTFAKLNITFAKLHPDKLLVDCSLKLGLKSPTWMSNYIHSKVTYEIPYIYSSFNVCAVQIWEGISKFITHFTQPCEYLSMLGLKLNSVSNRGYDVPPAVILINSSPPAQNGCHFPDNIFKWIFMK